MLVWAFVIGGKAAVIVVVALGLIKARRVDLVVVHRKVPVGVYILRVRYAGHLLQLGAQLVAECRVGAGGVVEIKAVYIKTVHIIYMIPQRWPHPVFGREEQVVYGAAQVAHILVPRLRKAPPLKNVEAGIGVVFLGRVQPLIRDLGFLVFPLLGICFVVGSVLLVGCSTGAASAIGHSRLRKSHTSAQQQAQQQKTPPKSNTRNTPQLFIYFKYGKNKQSQVHWWYLPASATTTFSTRPLYLSPARPF